MQPRPKAVIVDIDGTVASHELPDGTLIRGHFDYRAVLWDHPKHDVIAVVEALRSTGHEIIFCSGRPIADDNGYRVDQATRAWLVDHLGPWAGLTPLFMRPQFDMRADDVIKREIFDAWIAPTYDVRLALDDRDRVVAMWRSLGLTCLQVAPGNF